MQLIYQTQSNCNLIRIFRNGNELWLKLGSGNEIHSIFKQEHYLLEPVGEYYWNFFNILPLLKKDAKIILILGLGCGTLSRQLAHYFPELDIVGVEIDEAVVNAGLRFFELVQPNLIVHIDDGIKFLKRNNATYDIIVLDAFTKGNINSAFVDKEIFRLIKNRLEPDGILAINYLDEGDVSRNIKQNILPIFKQVYEISVEKCYNKVLFASDKRYNLHEARPPNPELKKIAAHILKKLKILKNA